MNKTAATPKSLAHNARRCAQWLGCAAVALLAGCSAPPPPAGGPTTAPPAPAAEPSPSAPSTSRPAPSTAPAPAPAAPRVSVATTPRDYRRDGAGHIYALNGHRIFKGMLPPNLYAIGTLQVDLDRQGRVTALRWMRAPNHAPEVVKEIERTVREASPFPIPQKLGRVTYTDTWLWDKSGHFQLDTLTEGQL
jgi:hypothetical protein